MMFLHQIKIIQGLLFLGLLLAICGTHAASSWAQSPFALKGQQTHEQQVQHPEKGAASNMLAPLKKKLAQWQVTANREISKRMQALSNTPTATVIIGSLFAAFLYGVLHTLGPGHGKMVVATYFLSHGTHFGRGVLVGAQVALSHVMGAVILVFATDLALRQVMTDPDAHVFWVRVISYGMIVLIGVYMLVQALRKIRGESVSSCSHCGHHGHHEHHHEHAPVSHAEAPANTKGEMLLSWCVGAVPCTGSLLILLYAMAHNMLTLGLLMVLSVALGMAVAMTTIGLLCILGKRVLFDKAARTEASRARWRAIMEIVGASCIMLLGLVLLSGVIWLKSGL